MRTYIFSPTFVYKLDIPYISGHAHVSISSRDLTRTTQGGSVSNQEVGMCMTMQNQILYFC